ncbi:hypothetical protein ACN38_g4345 [Penicillium nordicum]|uniref:Uncharacterized protein n=1 Tax=Penicillium nordicum TaxID=229535 RepID=A0A0M9WH65_9EURO|nr:hypothetical protein ACN38_g4345 [Penicillium nordicum]
MSDNKTPRRWVRDAHGMWSPRLYFYTFHCNVRGALIMVCHRFSRQLHCEQYVKGLHVTAPCLAIDTSRPEA